MTFALIFAGGTGKRMNSRSKPKQFLEMHGKPIIIYTLEHFEYHEGIDAIVIVCIKEWISELRGLMKRYGITKVKSVVPGGETGHDSIYLGLRAMKELAQGEDIVLINEELITQNINMVKKYGNAITSEEVRESIVQSKNGKDILNVPKRSEMFVAKAPQSFRYGRILELYQKAEEDNFKAIDSSHLCHVYQEQMHLVPSTKNNIKITEPADFYIYRALYEALEGQQIFGV